MEYIARALGQRDARDLFAPRIVEHAELDGLRIRGLHRNVDAVRRELDAKRLRAAGIRGSHYVRACCATRSRKSAAYCFAGRSHPTSVAIAFTCKRRQASASRASAAARSIASSRALAVTGANWIPVPVPAASAISLASMTVSESPPTRATMGNAP